MNGLTAGAAPGRAPDSLGVNQQVADKLRQAADLLAQQGANPFRVSAYRRAADAITGQGWDLRQILDREGPAGLVALPCIGRGIAAAIVEMLRTGRLPVLHTRRGRWHFTALYSNTARAHDLGRTRDWVVVYFYDDDHQEGQHTIVTETQGPLAAQRVVRGREAECHARHSRSRPITVRPGRRRAGAARVW